MEIKVAQADKEFAQSVGKRLVEDGFVVGCCNLQRRDGEYLADIIAEDFAVWRIDAQAELIEALEVMLVEFGNDFENGYAVNKARSVLAKAKGEE